MAREVERVETFRQERKYRMDRDVAVVRCDDGTVYEFEDHDGIPKTEPPRLVRSVAPDGEMKNTGARKALPAAVEETVETLFGGWSK